MVVRPTILDGDALAFEKSGVVKALSESIDYVCETTGRCASKKPDHRHPRLLRPCRQRPRRRRAAEQRDDLSPPHHSITSSARASTVAGISRPSALADLRLTMSSYLVGACTGCSAGFSPLRMRST